MPRRTTVLRGISEIGAVRAAADVSFGKTTPNGVTLAFTANQLEVESGQATMLEDLFVTSQRIDITARLIFANLVTFKEVMGLADAALTGDLDAATPTAEVLTIQEDAIGARTDALYVITPGPAGARRYDFARAKIRGGMTVELSRDQHVIVEGTWSVLATADATAPVTITDAL